MSYRGRIYQPSMIKALREIYETNSAKVKKTVEQSNKMLESAADAAALARDAATLLAEADPEWKNAADDSPAAERLRHLAAWRDALDFLELHPGLCVSGYNSLSVDPADGKPTPEFVAALEQHGFTVSRSDTRITADLWFGDYSAKLYASAKIEPPPVEAQLPEAAPVDEAAGAQT